MRDKLELKIVAIMVGLMLIGITAAGYMVVTIEKTSLYESTGSSSEVISEIIARDVERTMLEGKSDVTKKLVAELKSIHGVEEIGLFAYDGRPAFDRSAAVSEDAAMKKITANPAPIHERGVKKLIHYEPLVNKDACKTCHANDPTVLGAVKVTLTIEKEYDRAMKLIAIVLMVTVFACVCFSLVLWAMIRKMVITPIKDLERASQKLSDGDFSFRTEIETTDEIGRFAKAVKESMQSIGGILKRVKEISRRVASVTEDVERDSRKVMDGASLEAEAISNISASVEEMNAAISDIADGTEGLAASAEETAASMEQMVASITQITEHTQELSAAVDSTSASIEQLSATLKEVDANSRELTAAAGETQSAIMQISAAVKEVEMRAKESAKLSERVKEDAITFGMKSVEKTINGMKDIKSSVEKTAECIQKLGGRSEEIGKILNVIDEITDQTTLLALNAAILAAQAGEHGKGFSVVADEIKELADRTSMSTQEIGHLIQSVQQEVGDAVSAMEEGLGSVETGFRVTSEAADALRKIVESATRSYEMASAIDRSTEEQAKAARLVTDAMEKMSRMIEEIAKATSEQNKGVQLIMRATQRISDVSAHVKTATSEQSLNSKQISQAVELVSDKSQQISRAINEQKIGSNQIWASIEKIKDLPKENKERAFNLNQHVRDLLKDTELVATQMEKFRFSDDADTGLLRLGVVPIETPAVMFKRFSPLAEYLSKQLNRRVDLKVAVDFQGAVRDIGQGVTQVCFMTPSTYIEANAKFGVQTLVKALRDGKPYQHSVIVTRADSGIQQIEDLKGKSFAFGDPHSTSSHIVPRAMLHNAGIEVSDLLYYNYLGHHDDVARAVLNGDFDAGGIMEATAQKFTDLGLRVLKASEDVPEFNFCVNPALDPKTAEALKAALTGLTDATPEGAAVLKSMSEHYTGMVEANDEEYNGIRLMMSKIGLI
ncbi:MAG: hypothetical protein OHK006_23550 [Thermodesulfovibrionales bacterium]